MKRLAYLILLLVVVGCTTPPPQPQSTFTAAPSLSPSSTVLPIVSPDALDSYLGRSDPTSAAQSSQPDLNAEPSIVPLATEATIPITVLTDDGAVLVASYYGAAARPAPAVVMLSSDPPLLYPLSSALQTGGYNVMLLFPRGIPPSSDVPDNAKSISDALEALATLQTIPSINKLILLGERQNSLSALAACTQTSPCSALILINPLPNDALLTLDEALALLGSTPLLILAGQDVEGTVQTAELISTATGVQTSLQVYPTVAFDQASLAEVITMWLKTLP